MERINQIKQDYGMGVPKKIFLEYARENEDKKLAEQMIKENRYGTNCIL